MLELLKLGIAWEAILNFTEGEIHTILGIELAIKQLEQDQQARSSSANKMNFPNIPM
tara:strand:- start:340 stop:510 length:171 start_codon:yes stop_codon:yes gene_type:complete